jgi:aconitate hydratase
LVEKYAKAQGMWHDPSVEPRFSQVVELDLSSVVPSISGPKRPQDRISLSDSKSAFEKVLPGYFGEKTQKGEVSAGATRVKNGDVVIASITSCTNTSNPSNPKTGSMYFNPSTNLMYIYNGTTWRSSSFA